jgi:hypothetical protein
MINHTGKMKSTGYKMNPGKILVMTALVFSMILTACHSNQNANGTPTRLDPAGVPQPPAIAVVTSSAPMPPGRSPDNPAPAGYTVHADNMKFIVSGVVRPADDLVASGSMFNAQAGDYRHYIFVSLQVTCEISLEQTCHLSPFNVSLSGSDGTLNYPERLITGVDNVLVSTDLESGAVIKGYVPFIISIGDSRLLLIYESLSGEKYYLALP